MTHILKIENKRQKSKKNEGTEYGKEKTKGAKGGNE
jgi:hypothetical protein